VGHVPWHTLRVEGLRGAERKFEPVGIEQLEPVDCEERKNWRFNV
jgi:hypothetical protein